MEFGRGESWLPEILVTVAVERVFTLYMMQDAVREMTIYMNTSIHTSFLFSYMPVTCQLHAPSTVLKGFYSVLGLFRVAQLHACYMSYAQVTTSNSRERPQIAK